MEGQDFYHICTNGVSQNMMFRDEEDYIYGMNCIPLCKALSDVLIYAFCLMDNHVHFILRSSHSAGVKFISTYRRLVSRRISIKYNLPNPFPDADILLKKIDSPAYLLTAIAYVLRNPMTANMPVQPAGYRWSSANLYFSDMNCDSRPLNALTVARKREILHSRISLPDDYLIDSRCMILPRSYTEYEKVEKMFQSPKQLLFYLSKSNDAEIEIDTGILTKTRYRDHELKASLDSMSMNLFKKEFQMLQIEKRYKLAKEIHKRYGASAKQIARITGLKPDHLKILIR